MTTTPSHSGWFPVERSDHIGAGQVVQSMLHGQEIALWRAADGSLNAWENRCPHRSVRLTLGFVAGDQLVCRYHGWRYGSDGRCTGVPSTPAMAPPSAACVRSYACRESAGIVWASLAPLPRGYPPKLVNLEPCRSFTVATSLDTTAALLERSGFTGSHPGVWREDHKDAALLLLQPLEVATTVLHLFVDRLEAGNTAPDDSLRRKNAIARTKALLASLSQSREMTGECIHA